MRCIHCMKEIKDARFCPFCGKSSSGKNPLHHLSVGTVLNNRYRVDQSIGEGGFGITYVGFDQTLHIKVAIKEYFPSGCATRNNTVSNNINLSITRQRENYRKGMERFLDEARSIAKFSNERGIVDVRDFFTENNTAYIIMEFIEGKTLMQHLTEDGPIPTDKLLTMMLPLIRTLEKIHNAGVIHRDISPDNIILENESGALRLIDFGAARYYTGEESKSLSVVLRPGYAPYEQYSSKGDQGARTDVYALCATIYKCITNVTPPASLDRCMGDTLQSPSKLNSDIPLRVSSALLHGLAIYPQDRIQNMRELIDELYYKNDKIEAEAKPAKKKSPALKIILASIAAAVIAAVVLVVLINIPAGSKDLSDKIKNAANESKTFSCSSNRILTIGSDKKASLYFFDNGTVENVSDQLKTGDNLAAVECSEGDFIGLNADGTVSVLFGSVSYETAVSSWRNISKISVGRGYLLGLKNDGTVLAEGEASSKDLHPLNVTDWTGISDISADWCSLGLKSDGTVMYTDFDDGYKVWSDIGALNHERTYIAVKNNGTIAFRGNVCPENWKEAESWTGIVSVSAQGTSENDHIVGLTSDGTAVAAGNNDYGQCEVSDWKDITAIQAGKTFTIGKKSDGTFVIATNDKALKESFEKAVNNN